MITNISAWKISSLNEYSVQIRLGSNLGGFFLFQEEGGCLQGGSIKSDPTANKAVAKIMTTEALIKCDFSGDVLKGVDRAEEFVSDAYLLRKMRNDYQLFNKQVETLGAEKDVFEKYLTREMSLSDIAELQNLCQFEPEILNQAFSQQ